MINDVRRNWFKWRRWAVALCISTSLFASREICAQSTNPKAAAVKPATGTVTRVFYQDDQTKTLKWADLKRSSPPALSMGQVVANFPKIDPDKQSLVQMKVAGEMILLGIRDNEDGNYASGWILVDTGVRQEPHGDHSHWAYPQAPRVRAAVLDKNQGNPAHVYVYDNVFYVANDKNNGYTRLDPAGIQPKDDQSMLAKRARFFPGGGGHITLAVHANLGFASWIDREGDNMGRIDITELSSTAGKISKSIQLPHGGIHGATANQGKVFFAPSDGICWMDVPKSIQGWTPQVQHLSLGTSEGKPRRTGAFTSFGNHVAFVTGAGKDAAFCWLDASVAKPTVTRLAIEMADGNRPSSLEVVRPRKSSPMAFVFHDHPSDIEAPNLMTVIRLDPNQDGQWSDAVARAPLTVGSAQIEGHSGHHSICFDANRRWAMVSNSGDGTLTLMEFVDGVAKVTSTFSVGGAPSSLVAVGGASGH